MSRSTHFLARASPVAGCRLRQVTRWVPTLACRAGGWLSLPAPRRLAPRCSGGAPPDRPALPRGAPGERPVAVRPVRSILVWGARAPRAPVRDRRRQGAPRPRRRRARERLGAVRTCPYDADTQHTSAPCADVCSAPDPYDPPRESVPRPPESAGGGSPPGPGRRGTGGRFATEPAGRNTTSTWLIPAPLGWRGPMRSVVPDHGHDDGPLGRRSEGGPGARAAQRARDSRTTSASERSHGRADKPRTGRADGPTWSAADRWCVRRRPVRCQAECRCASR
jgi:hypothetical protein